MRTISFCGIAAFGTPKLIAMAFAPFWGMNVVPGQVTRKKEQEADKLINRYLSRLANRQTQYAYIERHKNTHHNVPFWALAIAPTFGTVSKMYEFSKPQVQSAVSREFDGITEQQLKQLRTSFPP